jgi:hypothetical protein
MRITKANQNDSRRSIAQCGGIRLLLCDIVGRSFAFVFAIFFAFVPTSSQYQDQVGRCRKKARSYSTKVPHQLSHIGSRATLTTLAIL